MNKHATAIGSLLRKGNATGQLSSCLGKSVRPIEWLGLTLLVVSFIGWPAAARGQYTLQDPDVSPQPRRIIDEAVPGEGAEKKKEQGKESETETVEEEGEEAEQANDPPPDHPALAGLVQQLEMQHLSTLQAELHLAFLVGQFPKPQREAIDAQVRDGFRALVREWAEARLPNPANVQRGRGGGLMGMAVGRGVPGQVVEQAVVNGRVVGMVRPNPADPSDIASQMEQLISDAMAEHASPEKVERFKQEREKRATRLKQVIISNIVTGLDERLLLTPSQRQEVTSLLDKHWNSPNPQLLDQFTYPNDNGWLPIADNLVMSILTPSQRRVWMDRRGQHTVVFNAVGGMGMQNFRIDDSMWKGFDRDEEVKTQ